MLSPADRFSRRDFGCSRGADADDAPVITDVRGRGSRGGGICRTLPVRRACRRRSKVQTPLAGTVSEEGGRRLCSMHPSATAGDTWLDLQLLRRDSGAAVWVARTRLQAAVRPCEGLPRSRAVRLSCQRIGLQRRQLRLYNRAGAARSAPVRPHLRVLPHATPRWTSCGHARTLVLRPARTTSSAPRLHS
jgi:hypothetical protein